MAEYYHEQWQKKLWNDRGCITKSSRRHFKICADYGRARVGLLDSLMTLAAFLPILWGLSKQVNSFLG